MRKAPHKKPPPPYRSLARLAVVLWSHDEGVCVRERGSFRIYIGGDRVAPQVGVQERNQVQGSDPRPIAGKRTRWGWISSWGSLAWLGHRKKTESSFFLPQSSVQRLCTCVCVCVWYGMESNRCDGHGFNHLRRSFGFLVATATTNHLDTRQLVTGRGNQVAFGDSLRGKYEKVISKAILCLSDERPGIMYS